MVSELPDTRGGIIPKQAMITVDKDTFTALRNKIRKNENLEECREHLKSIIEIKQAHEWRADIASCFCVGWALPVHLGWEVRLLEESLWALEDGDTEKAARKLDELIKIQQE
ncbi:MAG: hypothetical protein U1D67_07110 [Dehalococcoidia bacterium]|nr:hypothetical protein [Dehalococcoidia bacterium]MDZ4246870.1 hypothetical protein [Dehalococcoidia bacterium]